MYLRLPIPMLERTIYTLIVIIAFLVAAKLIKPDFPGINNILKTIFKEIRLLSDAKFGGFINLVMVVFASIVAFLLISPSFLENIGLVDGDNSLDKVLGVGLIIFVFYISAKYLFKYEIESDLFKREQQKEDLDSDS